MINAKTNQSDDRNGRFRPFQKIATPHSQDDRTDRYQTLRFLIGLIVQQKKLAFVIVASNLLAALFDGSTFAVLAIAMDSFLQAEEIGAQSGGQLGFLVKFLQQHFAATTLFVLLIGLAVLTQLLYAAFFFGGRAAMATLQANVEIELSRGLLHQFLNIAYAQISRYKIGNLISYFEQVRQAGRVLQYTNTLLSNALTVCVYVGVLIWLSWSMTLVAVLVIAGVMFFLRAIIFKIRALAKREIRASVRVNERINEFLQGMRLVRTFAQEETVKEEVEVDLQKSRQYKRSGLIWSGAVGPLFESVLVIAVAVFLLASYFLTGVLGTQPLAQTAVFLVVLYRLMPRMSTFNGSFARLLQLLPALRRVLQMLRIEDKEYLSNGTVPFAGLKHSIDFSNVSFQYADGAQSAIDNLNLTLNRGHMVALVGQSGAGKSTIVNLLLRLYDPTGGEIQIDGVNLRDLELDSWRRRIGIVDQDPFLLNRSIGANIAFGAPDATEAEIIAAARAANAHDFIVDLEQGYDTVVGDRGSRLSGGQRQRISIARALLRKPDLLIFDEATSDLDSESEQLIQQALENLSADRTLLVIAHRLSTIAMADKILVLERGQLMEQGTHEELLAQNGSYARFWHIQSSGT